MRQGRISLLVITVLALVAAGDRYPRNDFRSPLGIPLSLSGNFAEMRANHFHTGLDIRTNGTPGYRVYATADGWVSRIAVSPTGYGNALYVTHPNGYQTVYGHLDRFSEAIDDYVRSAQYARRSFSVDLAPDEERFPVKQGDVIAYSGNSGSSGGPHVHFEIRDAATSEPINPLLFGLPVQDTTPPRIYSLRIYPLDRDGRAEVVSAAGKVLSRARFGSSATAEAASAGNGRYRLTAGAGIRASGRVGFGMRAHDYHDGSSSRLGAYTIELQADGQRVFKSEMERLDFALNRYLNAHVDYAEHERSGLWVQRSYLLPGNNRLRIYDTLDRGVLSPAEGQETEMRYEVTDVFENRVSLDFSLVGLPAPTPPEGLEREVLPWERSSVVNREGFRLEVPSNALYDDVDLVSSEKPARAGSFSPVYTVLDRFTPLQSAVTVSIDASDLPARLRPFALVARETDRGGMVSEGGEWADGWVSATTRTFGSWFITADTTAPVIRAVNISDGASLAGASSIRFRISDNLAGISTYEGRVDGEWVLFGFDAKTATLEHVFDGRITRGRHQLELRVTDGVGNSKRWVGSFTR